LLSLSLSLTPYAFTYAVALNIFYFLPALYQNPFVAFIHALYSTLVPPNRLPIAVTMAPNIVASATSGMLFGAALSAAGVASPSVILQQLRLEDFHMLEVFLTATASSAYAFPLLTLSHSFAFSSSFAPWSSNSIDETWSIDSRSDKHKS
jgi:hypothetical protein